MRIAQSLLLVALITLSATAQTTYRWTGTTDSIWTTATNWSPSRSSPATNDVLVFDGSQIRQPALSASQTVGRIVIIGSTTLSIVNGTSTFTLTASGGSPNCLNVSPGDTLNINATGTSGNGILSVGTGGGVDSGIVTILGRAQLQCTDTTNKIVFAGGAAFNASQSTGNPFGPSTATANSIEFKSGSTFNHNSGSNPFARSQPNSIVIFDQGSNYKFNFASSAFITAAGRTYPNLTFGGTTGIFYAQPSSGSAACTINGTLTINPGISLRDSAGNGGWTGNYLIEGNINNNGYWDSPAGDTVVFSGSSTVLWIMGSGTTVLHHAVISANALNTQYYLFQDIIDSGSVVVTGLLKPGMNAIKGPGSFLLGPNTWMGLEGPNGVNSAIQVTGTKTFSTNTRYSFEASGPQITGSLMPDTVNTVNVVNVNGLTLSNTTALSWLDFYTNSNLITGPDTLIALTSVALESASDSAFVVGNLSYAVSSTGTFTYPIGSGPGYYFPATIHLTTLTGTGSINVSVLDSAITPPPLSLSDTLNMLEHYYRIGSTAGLTAYTGTLMLSYADADLARAGITNDSTLHAYRSSGTQWVDLPVDSRDVANNTISISVNSTLGTFILGDAKARVAPAAPSALAPVNDAQSQRADTLIFEWTSSPGATKYLFELSTSKNFSSLVVADSNVVDTTRTVVSLINSQKYYWRVSAYNLAGFGSFSAVDSFTTKTAVGVKQLPDVPSAFELYQNYPDPFNPSTRIRYALPKDSRVMIKVYDMIGRLVATLVDAHQTVGYHEVQFDGSRYASGVYFCRLTAPGVTITMKMLLTK